MSTKTLAKPTRLETLDWTPLPEVLGPLKDGLSRVLSGEAAERVVDSVLRAHRGLSGPQRQVLVEALFAVAIWRRRLAWHGGSLEPESLLWALFRDLLGFPEDWVKKALAWNRPVPPLRPPPDAPAILYSFPDWLFEGLEREVGEEAPELAMALNLPGPICLRVNRLKTTLPQLQETLRGQGLATRRGPWAVDCLHVETPRPNLLSLEAFRQGLFEVQDEGSQLLGELVSAKPQDTVLDLCAGAGGKTLQLASHMQNQGALHAFDINAERLSRLRQRAHKAGVENLHIHEVLPEGLKVDRCLVDAPCSEWGALRRGPDRRFLLAPSDVEGFPAVQRQLLETACKHLKQGGHLVYATCTFRREENEEVALAFEQAHPEFQRLVPEANGLPDSMRQGGFFRSYPHRHGTDGFFAAVYALRP